MAKFQINWFEKVQRYYNWNCYDDKDVLDFVSYGRITPEDYETITGKKYPTQN